MGEKFPSLKAAALEAIVKETCGEPIRRTGSHRTYVGPNGPFTFAFHAGDAVAPHLVKRILSVNLGLTRDESKAKVGM